jgi:hypothetical protein
MILLVFEDRCVAQFCFLKHPEDIDEQEAGRDVTEVEVRDRKQREPRVKVLPVLCMIQLRSSQ